MNLGRRSNLRSKIVQLQSKANIEFDCKRSLIFSPLVLGTILILRQQRDWVGGVERIIKFFLMFSTICAVV